MEMLTGKRKKTTKTSSSNSNDGQTIQKIIYNIIFVFNFISTWQSRMWFFPRCLSESLSPVCIHLISHISICYTANTWAAATILLKFIYNLFCCCCFTGCRPFLRSRRRKNEIHPKLERYLNSCTSTLMVEVQWAKRFRQIAQRVWEWDRETTSEIHTHTTLCIRSHSGLCHSRSFLVHRSFSLYANGCVLLSSLEVI